MAEPKLRIDLVEERGETSVFISAEIDTDGRFIISGEDIGKSPEEFWGDSDYEYWVVVSPDQKDRVLLALVEKLYKGDMKVVSKFRNLLSEKNIPSEFGSWV